MSGGRLRHVVRLSAWPKTTTAPWRTASLQTLLKPARQKLLSDAFKIEVPAGGMIYREGADPRAVLVVDGLVRVYMTSPQGRQVTVR